MIVAGQKFYRLGVDGTIDAGGGQVLLKTVNSTLTLSTAGHDPDVLRPRQILLKLTHYQLGRTMPLPRRLS